VSEVVIRRVEASGAALLRDVRLQALATNPSSFGSTYEREAAFPDQTWTERAARSAAGDDATTLLALRDDAPVGVVTAMRNEAKRQLFHVVGMWVAPDVRREGVGRRLLAEAEAWIARCAGTRVQLSVTNHAAAALRLYERAGYTPDGYSADSAHTAGLIETSLGKQL
jgi:ribosomal protein S18 acetylase RimI-like enzyme